MTLLRSTPSSVKIRTAVRPPWCGPEVCTVIGRAGLQVRAGDRAGDPLDAGGQFGRLHGALEEGGLDTGVADALGDVAGEVGDHRLGHVDQQAGPAVRVLLGHLLVDVQAGRDDDVDRRLPPRSAGCAGCSGPGPRPWGRRWCGCPWVQGVQLGDGVRDPGLLVPPVAAVVLHVLGGEHEDMLVHQGLAQAAQVDRATHALDDCHEIPFPTTLSGGSVSGPLGRVNGPGPARPL